MFVRHKQVYSTILFCADIAAALVALAAAYWVRSLVRFVPLELSQHFNPVLLPFREYLFYFLLFLPLWMGLLRVTQRYSRILHLPALDQATRVVRFLLISGVLMAFLTYSFKLEVSRPIFFAFFLVAALLMGANRALLVWILRSRNINEHNQIHMLIVGTSEGARRLARQLEGFQRWGFHVVGHLLGNGEQSAPGVNVLGTLDDLPRLLREGLAVNEIVFFSSDVKELADYEEMIRLCEDLGIRIRMAADFLPTAASRISVDFVEDLPLLTLSTAPDHSLALVAKRVLDFLVASAGIVLFSPVMAAAAFLIKLSSPGPIFYRQVRCGQYGRPFELIKFRTMIEGAEDRLWEIKHLNEMTGPVFKMRNDPRVTWIGNFLRKSSIDELPQFWNVLKGEMSIVGPRAPLREEVRHYSIKQRRRLSVKPGITCLWQVSGRSEIDFQQWMDLDLQYIDNWSLWLDLKILWRTVPVVLGGVGAK